MPSPPLAPSVPDDLLSLLAAVVHRHVLATLHAATGVLLARLDEDSERSSHAGSASVEPAPAKGDSGNSFMPATTGDRQGAGAHRERQTTSTPSPTPSSSRAAAAEPEAEWLQLRERVCTAVKARGVTYAKLAVALEASRETVAGWLAPSHADRKPSARAQAKLLAWLDGDGSSSMPAPPSVRPDATHDTLPVHKLSADEQGRLTLDLSVSGESDLRRRFGANRELLGQAAAGDHLDAAIVERVRQTLAGEAACGPTPG